MTAEIAHKFSFQCLLGNPKSTRAAMLQFSIEVLQELSKELTVSDLSALEKISTKISELEKLK